MYMYMYRRMQASIEALPGPIRSHEANLLRSLWGGFLEHTIIVNRVQSIRSEMRVYTILYSQQDAQVYFIIPVLGTVQLFIFIFIFIFISC